MEPLVITKDIEEVYFLKIIISVAKQRNKSNASQKNQHNLMLFISC